MSERTQAVAMHQAVAPEDQVRANFYALLSRLYADAPDAALLRGIAGAGELPGESEAARELASTWSTLGKASAAMDPEAAADEYQALFIGVGKSEVSLYASSYLPSGGTSVRGQVRATLGRLGLERKPEVNVYEDHLAAICETMRALIVGTGGTEGPEGHAVGEQREFFEMHVAPWVSACCSAICACPIANYYRPVAKFTQAFMAIERDSFAID